MSDRGGAGRVVDGQGAFWGHVAGLVLWLAAARVAFLPFALDTSPWDAVRLHVPGNQGNWWHFLAGAPFFLAFPMVWLRLRALLAKEPSTRVERRMIWAAVVSSIGGTVMVETPFLLHLAGTSAWQRFIVLGLGFGIMVGSLVALYVRRGRFSLTAACMVALDTAYLANAALCLVVYSDAAGGWQTRSGWLVTMVLVWGIGVEMVVLFWGRTFRARRS